MNDYAGNAVASAGDVNFDGFADVLVGAPGFDGAGAEVGAAYVVLGAARPPSSALGDAVVQLVGEGDADGAGGCVSSAGDVDGDGYDDPLVGAYRADDGGEDAGAAYLVLGASAPVGGPLSDAEARLTGETAGDDAAVSQSGAGDLNDDGYVDMVIGAPGADLGGDDAGATYVVLGSRSPTSRALGDADAVLTGEAEGDGAGLSVAIAGDVDLDGYDDLLVGAGGDDSAGADAGAAYLVLGATSPASASLAAAAAKLRGELPGDVAGAVAPAGDVNRDGYDDLLVTAYTASYLILGNGL